MEGEAARLAEAVHLLPVGTLPPGALEALAARLSRRVELAWALAPAALLALVAVVAYRAFH